jgi:radical SAM superfamily enzyme YgiQ (UPF0313 family)
LALIENILIADVQDRPDLGCAMLMGACAKHGVDVKLIQGQTRFMRDIFLEDADELWELIHNSEYMDKVVLYDQSIGDLSVKKLAEYLKNKYDNMIASKDPRVYLNAEMVSEFVHLYSSIMAIYSLHLEKGHCLRMIDRYIDEIKRVKPDAVGFSLWSQRTPHGCTAYDPFTGTIRRRLREEYETKIIVGGPFTAFVNDSDVIEMYENDHVDYMILGAADHALPELMNALSGDGSLDAIDNLVRIKNEKLFIGNISAVSDLCDLPYPEFEQFDLDRYASPQRLLPIFTSRGCSWGKCAFCGYGAINCNRYQSMPAERVVETLRYLQDKYRCRYFALHEEQITPKAAAQLCECIIRNELDVRLSAYARFEDGYDDDNLWKMMYRAGFRSFNWGLESGNQRVLNMMRKGIKIDNVRKILRESQDNKISNNVFIFFGFPGETREEADDTVKFLQQNHDYISAIEYGTFVFAKKSPININPEKWGVKKINGEYIYPDGAMTQGEVEAYHDGFRRNVLTGNTKINSIPFTPPPFLSQMYCLMISSHGIMKHDDIFRAISKGDYDQLYPVIMGERQLDDGNEYFVPVAVDDTAFNNMIKPKQMIELDELSSKIIMLSDGSRTVREIIDYVLESDEGDQDVVEGEIVEIFEDIYDNKMAFAFMERWPR